MLAPHLLTLQQSNSLLPLPLHGLLGANTMEDHVCWVQCDMCQKWRAIQPDKNIEVGCLNTETCHC